MSEIQVFARFRRWLGGLPPIRVDLAITAAVIVLHLWPFISRHNPFGVPWHWWGYVVVVAASLPLIWRRRAPVPVLLANVCTFVLYDFVEVVPAQPITYGGLIALYTVAAYSRLWVRVPALVVVTVGGVWAVGSAETALRGLVQFAAAYAIGRAAASARAHAAALEERAAQLVRERQVEAERAAERERARIARDMHDILAHAVSLMVVQAEAGPVVVRHDPDKAEAAFDAIAEAGRDAMVQLRRVLKVLKEEEGPRAPQPAVSAIEFLAAQVRETGLEVVYSSTGEPRRLHPDAEVAAYRIAQEALTNIVKHAGATRADLRLTWQDDTLVLDITDDGLSVSKNFPEGGNGLIGIRERAAACGGTARTGPRADGRGFQVLVTLPLLARAVAA
ncbi:sensor histidine kinase [Nonomuraea longicatena]|uniref:sensor histidine kinase n=1 Tax=Nonomuraea longicatena TaxID=83682 RepID=UPI0031D8B520